MKLARNIACSVLFASERHINRLRPSERGAVVAARHRVAVAGRITGMVRVLRASRRGACDDDFSSLSVFSKQAIISARCSVNGVQC